MSEVKDQDETSGFEVQSEDFPETELTSQVEVKEEQASSEVTEDEGEGDSKKESTVEDKVEDKLADDTSAEVVKEKSNGFQKRINKEVRKREDLKRENEKLKEQLKEREGDTSDHKDKEPVEADFERYDKYLDALDKFDSKTETKDPVKEPAKQKEVINEGLTDNQKSSMAVIRESIDSDESKPEDFEAVALDPNVPITGEMLEALAECDNISAVMMQLGNDHNMALSIANKSPAQQMRAIAKLDLGIKVIPPKPVQKSTASDPINPVKGSEQHEKSDSEMSFSEFEAKDRERNSKRSSIW
jgi:hypothetical protein